MKKILALAMVLSVLGTVVAGCGAKAEDTAATPAATAGADGAMKSDAATKTTGE